MPTQRTPLPAALGAALTLGAACGGGKAPQVPIEPPATWVTDLARSEAAARALQEDLARSLLAGLGSDDPRLAVAAFAPGFRGRFPAPDDGRPAPGAGAGAGDLVVRRFGPGGRPVDGAGLVQLLRGHLGGARPTRRALEADRFWLEPEGGAAVARFELRLAGELGPGGARVDLRVTCDARALLDPRGTWTLTRLEARGGTRVENPGPRFRDVTAEVGLCYNVSAANRRTLQAFVDTHVTFALGGLSAVDWNRDGFWDLIGTRRGQLATLFLNDGAGGFLPEPLPVAAPLQCGSFLLWVDLDGDGLEELVDTAVLGYEGDRAWCGLYTREDGEWVHRPRALEFPNPLGLRRLATQTLVPFDADGDGDLDLFLGVYGGERSRGEHYNTVEAHDGADNHLFVNRGQLLFSEESEARGISGTQYTYVATAFDFDSDGDADLLEGNDFGPNVLWENDGTGCFQPNGSLGLDGVPAYTMGATLADYDNSGRWSLYLSNMSSEEGGRMVPLANGLSDSMRATVATIARGNMLYTRDPTTGRWEERAQALGCNEGEWAWGCTFFDVDDDGDRDLFVTNGFASHARRDAPDWQTYYWREVIADGIALQRGEPSPDVNAEVPFEGSFDGYERDRLFVNVGGRDAPLVEAGYALGLDDDHDGRCALPLDVDGDGDLDLALWTLTGLLLHENLSPPRRFARLALRGTGGHAVGAVVALTAGGVTQRSSLQLVDGFQTQVPSDLHFGLGQAQRIQSVEVRWPSGTTQTWRDLPVARRLVLVEGRSEARVEPLAAWPEGTRPRGVTAPGDALLETSDGGRRAVAATDRPTVLLLDRGLGTLGRLQALREAHPGARVDLALAPGAAGPNGLPLDGPVVLRATPEFLARALGEPAPELPATLVFDRQGRPVRTFRRAASAGDLAGLLATLEDEPLFPDLCVMAGRRALDESRPRVAERLFLTALEQGPLAPAHAGLGRVHLALERPDLAEVSYLRAVEMDPDYARAHFNLGWVRLVTGRPAEAIAPLQESLRIVGERPHNLLALGEAATLAERYDLALEAFGRAAAASGEGEGEEVQAHLNRAKLLGALKRYGEARLAYRRVLALEPGNADALDGLRLVERLLSSEGR